MIARREYLERIRSKAFRISTVLIPVFFSMISALAPFPENLAAARGILSWPRTIGCWLRACGQS